MNEHVRIAVVGGGLGGLTLANVLHRNGLASAVFDLDASPAARPQGGQLDIHVGTGQAALRAAGLHDAFLGIVHAGAEATRVLDRNNVLLHEDSGTGDRPEVDRGQLRRLLLEALPVGCVRWGKKLVDVEPLVGGKHALRFSDGTTVTCDLLVGGDSAWSRVRSLVSAAKPTYSEMSTAYPQGFTYAIPNVPAGRYSVTLDFAEVSGGGVTGPGQRQFDVLVDGKKVLANFDIYAEGGLDQAVFKQFFVDSSGGTLTLRFAPGASQNPKVNAIAIDPAPAQGHAIGSSFFGLHLQKFPAAVPFGTQRLWDSQTQWSALEPTKGSYQFGKLRDRLATAAAANVDVIYTFGRTPSWLSSNPGQTGCGGQIPGECAPPRDLDEGDQAAKDFWHRFMDEVCTDLDTNKKPKVAPLKTCGALKYIELWNEPNTTVYWTGTPEQLARMSADATAIIKHECESCQVLTAPVSCGGYGTRSNGQSGHCDDWADSYLGAWQKLGNLPDVGTWHPYPARTNISPAPFPESNVSASPACAASLVPNVSCDLSVVDQVKAMRSVFDAHGLAGKPMFGTEGSWGGNDQQPDTLAQAAYLARWFLAQARGGVARAYWYAEDNTLWGTLTGPETNNPAHAEDTGLNPAGVAYGQVYDWLVGSTIQACSTSGSIWSCAITKKDGTHAQALWDAAQTCTTSGSSHRCTTSRHTVATSFGHWHDLAGKTGAIASHAVDLGAQPILVD